MTNQFHIPAAPTAPPAKSSAPLYAAIAALVAIGALTISVLAGILVIGGSNEAVAATSTPAAPVTQTIEPKPAATELAEPVTEKVTAEPVVAEPVTPAQPGAAQPAAAVQQAVDPAPAQPAPAQPALKNNPKDNDQFWSSGGAGVFGGADDMVDPNFGATDYFDAAAQEEKVTTAPPMMAPPKPATRQPANNQAKQKPIRLATDPEPKPRAAAAPEDVVSPHKIGGNGAQKAANFVLSVLLVLLCFMGVVAALNDGMVDFKNFGHMLEVAFSGKPYQPRAEWVKASASTPAAAGAQAPSSDKAGDVPAPTVAGKADGLTTFNVTMERVRVKKRKSVMVVRGHVKNNTDKQVTGAKISAQIINSSGDVMAKGEAYSGKTLSTSVVKKAKTLKKIEAKLPTAPVAIDANTTQMFTVVLDAPAENDADAPVVYRVNAKIP